MALYKFNRGNGKIKINYNYTLNYTKHDVDGRILDVGNRARYFNKNNYSIIILIVKDVILL